MQTANPNMSKQWQQQAQALSREARGGGLNLGKKVSTPRDVMIEELKLNSNRGSRMFQERQKRVEKFTVENPADVSAIIYDGLDQKQTQSQVQAASQTQGGKENMAYPIVGKHSLVTSLMETISKKGSPDVLAPGYSGPLKKIPCEKFNVTVIPKLYCSPWREALRGNEELLSSMELQLPQPENFQPANYRCFNRVAMPFGGPMTSKRVIPTIKFEAMESQNLPGPTVERMVKRPNFNKTPRGWATGYPPESNEL
ncbi:Myozenin-2 [Bagarius yarrelli]|uniref:Myozenin-2 n=1 Tax=Bagarius yarrelli TaxID=175774 RepID=A0A556UZS0_BAGYA|nr:Myozenin-2 [Bagarius yarrelli]